MADWNEYICEDAWNLNFSISKNNSGPSISLSYLSDKSLIQRFNSSDDISFKKIPVKMLKSAVISDIFSNLQRKPVNIASNDYKQWILKSSSFITVPSSSVSQ